MSSLRLIILGDIQSRVDKIEKELASNNLINLDVFKTYSQFDAEQLLVQKAADAFIFIENDGEGASEYLNRVSKQYPELSVFCLATSKQEKPYNEAITCVSKMGLNADLLLKLVEKQVDNKRLKQELKVLTQNIKSNDNRSKALNEVYSYVAKDEQDMLDFALQKAITLTDSEFGYIYKYSEEKEQFTLNSWSNGVMKECEVVNPQTCYELAKTGFWGEAVRQRKAIILNDFKTQNPLKKGYPEGHVPLSRFMTTPVFDKDQIVAVVGMANKVKPYVNGDVIQLQLLLNSVWNLVKQRSNTGHINKLTKAVESTKASVVITNNLGEIEYANPYFYEHTGYAAFEAVGANPRVLKSGYHDTSFYEEMWNILTAGKTWEGELKNKKKNGELYWESAIISPIKNLNGVISHYVAVKTDITQQKNDLLELIKSQRDLKVFVENSGLAMMVYSPKGDVLLMNEASAKNLNGKISDFIGKNILELFPDDGKIYLGRLNKSLKSPNKLVFEDFVFNKYWFRSTYLPIYLESGVLWGVQIVSEDITTLKQSVIENEKQSIINEQALQLAKVYPWTFNIATDHFTFHKQVELFFEEKLPNFILKDVLYNKFYDADRKRVIEIFEKGWNKNGFKLEHRYKINEKIKWVRVSGKAMYNSEAQPESMVGVMIDITHEKVMLNQLEESEKLQASVIDALSEGLVVQDKSDKIVLANTSASEVLGLSMDQLLGKSSFDPLWAAHDIDDKPLEPAEHPSMVTLKTGLPINGFVMKVHTGNNDEKIININSRPIKNLAGETTQSVTTFADITQQQLAEQEIQEASHRLEHALDATSAALWDLNMTTGEAIVDNRWLGMLGYNDNELGKVNFDTWKSLLHPEDVERTFSKFNDFVKGKIERYSTDFRMKTNSGNYKWIWGQAKAVERSEDGQVLRMVGTNQDINESKEREKDLKISEENYRHLTESLTEIVWKADDEGNITYINNPGLKILGKDLETLKNSGWLSIIHKDDAETVIEKWTHAVSSKTEYVNQQRMMVANGTYHWFKLTAKPQFDENNKITVWVGLSIDINNEKIVAEKVLDLKERYSVATYVTSDAIWDWKIENNEITWNSTFAKNFRNENEANTYNRWINLVHPTDRDDVKDQLIRPLNDDFTEESHLEFRMRRQDNSYAFVSCNAKFLRGNDNSVERVIGSLKNITSEKLRMLEKELRYAVSNAIHSESILDNQLRATAGVLASFLKCELAEAWLVSVDNKQLKRKAAYIKDEEFKEVVELYSTEKLLITQEGLNVKAWKSMHLEVVKLDNAKSRVGFLRNEIAISKGLNTALALPIIQNEQVVAVFVLLSKQKEENFRIFYPLLQNISTDLGGEIQRLRSESERKLFFELSLDLLCIASSDGYFKKINPAFTSALGYSQEQILDIPFIDFVVNEDVERTKKFAQNLIENPGKTLYVENRYLRKDHTKVWLAWTAVYVESEDLIFATAKDFTERMNYMGAIEEQNKQLREIAWTQSHILRAPLVNIMGLVNLLEMGVEQGMNLDRILTAMKDSTAAFDNVIKEITKKSEVLYNELEPEKGSQSWLKVKPRSVQ